MEVLNEEERTERAEDLQMLIDMMRPAVQSDGGDLALVDADLEAGIIRVQLEGACSSCAISSSTLEGGVKRILMDRLEWVTEVIGSVEESDSSAFTQGTGGWVPRSEFQ